MTQSLAAVAHAATDVPRRVGVSLSVTAGVYARDSWTCRYCGVRTVAPPVLRVLSSLYPEQFPYHPNWKAGQVHPAYLLVSTSLDHLVPGARGGSWIETDNLVTSCWPCNTGKADLTIDEIGWTLLDETDVHSEWDGLTGVHRELWDMAGQPDAAYHQRWLRAVSR